jgi:hypothetical protein
MQGFLNVDGRLHGFFLSVVPSKAFRSIATHLFMSAVPLSVDLWADIGKIGQSRHLLTPGLSEAHNSTRAVGDWILGIEEDDGANGISSEGGWPQR